MNFVCNTLIHQFILNRRKVEKITKRNPRELLEKNSDHLIYVILYYKNDLCSFYLQYSTPPNTTKRYMFGTNNLTVVRLEPTNFIINQYL